MRENRVEERSGEGTRSPDGLRTRVIRQRLSDLIEELHAEVERMEPSGSRAWFQTAAQVLEGLRQGFEEFERRPEKGSSPVASRRYRSGGNEVVG